MAAVVGSDTRIYSNLEAECNNKSYIIVREAMLAHVVHEEATVSGGNVIRLARHTSYACTILIPYEFQLRYILKKNFQLMLSPAFEILFLSSSSTPSIVLNILLSPHPLHIRLT